MLAVPLLLWVTTTACRIGEGSRDTTTWRALPLTADGQIHPDWAHTGWGGFSIDDGALRTDCDPRGLGLLVYRRETFGDCQIRIVFRSKDAASNAGVYVRIADGILDQLGKTGPAFERDAAGRPSDTSMRAVQAAAARGEGPWFAVHHGYEIQITEAADPFHRTGAVYSLAPATGTSGKPPGEWKTMIITLAGNILHVDLDGQRVTAFDPASPEIPPQKQWYEPRREPARPIKGYIGLQNHDPGDVVWFKEISVRPLPRGDRP